MAEVARSPYRRPGAVAPDMEPIARAAELFDTTEHDELAPLIGEARLQPAEPEPGTEAATRLWGAMFTLMGIGLTLDSRWVGLAVASVGALMHVHGCMKRRGCS